MCGIVGIFNYRSSEPVKKDLLERMRDSMYHRGPDDTGVWISADKRIGLGHRRLSIIDLSEMARQPMCNEDATLWVVYNGEIYNHFEIRPELEEKGHVFKTDHSDTEVIVHAFEEWGIACLEKFRGMFAIAVWDAKSEELWLMRDRIGIKPLYYTIYNGCISFASEIKALLIDPRHSRKVNEEAFYSYLTFLASPAPHTMFEGINKLPCGTWLRVSDKEGVYEQRYWDLDDSKKDMSNLREDEIAERLLSELRTAVKLRKISDVPVGVFLSGGIDSSINAALFSEGESNLVSTFSVGYDKEYEYFKNELGYASEMARLVGANHHEIRLSEDDLINFLPKLIYHQDEPLADSSCIPTYYLSKLSKDNNVTVCQVGEGGDELFCGYPSWLKLIKLQNIGKLPLSMPFKWLGLFFMAIMGKGQTRSFEWLRRSAHNEPVFWGGIEGFTERQKRKLLSSRLNKKFASYSSCEVLKPILKRFNENFSHKTPLNWMTYLDLNLRLPELLLMRVDKMSMAVSLETRVPFLDHKFVELVIAIPESVRLKEGELKYILKKAASDLIPKETINRKKQGFSSLLAEWFFKSHRDIVFSKINNFIARTDYFDRVYLETLLNSGEYNRIWQILNFVLWHERWIEGIE